MADCYVTALRILGYRFNSEAELRRKLLAKRFDRDTIAETPARLRDEKWLEQERFPGADVRAFWQKGNRGGGGGRRRRRRGARGARERGRGRGRAAARGVREARAAPRRRSRQDRGAAAAAGLRDERDPRLLAVAPRQRLGVGAEVVARDRQPVDRGRAQQALLQKTAARGDDRQRQDRAALHSPREVVVLHDRDLAEAGERLAIDELRLIAPRLARDVRPQVDGERGPAEAERALGEGDAEAAEVGARVDDGLGGAAREERGGVQENDRGVPGFARAEVELLGAHALAGEDTGTGVARDLHRRVAAPAVDDDDLGRACAEGGADGGGDVVLLVQRRDDDGDRHQRRAGVLAGWP